MKYMNKLSSLKMLVLFFGIALLLSGCGVTVNTGGTTSTAGANDGGVFKSSDKGDNWEQKILILSIGRQRSFAAADILSLAMDPSDNQAIYAGSLGNGLLYSYDGTDSWQIAVSLGQINVVDIAVDPADKCSVYAASDNKVFKTSDCGRSWSPAYFDNDLGLKVTSIVIDYTNSNNVFIGTSRGGLIKSSDRGASWRAIARCC